jgi:hypothetical protein
MTNSQVKLIYTRAVETAAKDPKKTGLLFLLVLLFVVLAVRTLGSGKGRPQAAGAAVARGGAGNRGFASQGKRAVTVNPRLQRWAEAPVRPLSRNLFTVRLDYFPVEGPRNGANLSRQGDDGFWVKLEKSLVLQADQRDKRENQVANYKAQAAQLKLQSTIMGPQPKALVNGELVGEGDVVASFRVLRIEARRVIIEREGIRLEIQMK